MKRLLNSTKMGGVLVTLLLAFSMNVAAQTQVRGTVVDERGDPLPGATVMIQGTAQGTATDVDGNFTLSAPAGGTLIISFLGYNPQSVPVSANVGVIRLVPDMELLGEVIVTGFGTFRREFYTGSASVVTSEVLGRTQVTNVSRALEGVVPGLQTTSGTGQPGSAATLRLRGIGSIHASNAPLIVLDGAPFAGTLDQINPDDIESISILRDATSAALYGSRGANGVILIQTRRGRGQPRINVRVTHGVTSRGLPEYNLMNAEQYLNAMFTTMTNQRMSRTVNPLSLADARAELAGTGPGSLLHMLGGYNPFLIPNDQLFDPVTGLVRTGGGLRFNDCWEREMIQNASRQEVQFSATMGDARNSYFVSLGYINDAGIIAQTGFTRLTARLNARNEIRPWLRLESSLSASRQEMMNQSDDGTNSMNNPFSFARNIPRIFPVFQYDFTVHDRSVPVLDTFGNRLFDFGGAHGRSPGTGPMYRPFNPNNNMVAMLPLDRSTREVESMAARFAVEFDLIDGLTYRFQGAADVRNLYAMEWMNMRYGFGEGVRGRLQRWQDKTFSYTATHLLTYTRTFGEHNLTAMVGHEHYVWNFQHLFAHRTGFPFPTTELALGANLEGATSFHDNLRREGYLSSIHYGFRDTYILSASFRRDASSRFHPNNRWGNFWSLGGAWNISREDFFRPLSGVVDMARFRISYGAQGNDGTVSLYPWQGVYNLTFSNQGMPGAFRTTLDAFDLTWESQRMFNTGIDFALFGRLRGSLEYYIRDNRDMLFQRQLPNSGGIGSRWENVGAMRTAGVEFQIDYDIINTRDWQWSVGLNATHWRNRITRLAEEDMEYGLSSPFSTNQRVMVGHSIHEWFVHEFAGVDATGRALYFVADNELGPGRVGLDRNGLTTLTAQASRYFTGKSAIPIVHGGFNTVVRFRGFDFAAMFSYSLGGYILDGIYSSLMHMGTFNWNNLHVDILNSWTPENNNQNMPQFNDFFGADNWGTASSRWLVSSSFLNVRNVTFGYTLPQETSRRIHVENLRGFITLDNFWQLSARRGMNPQASLTGVIDSAQTSFFPTKTMTFGIQLQI